MAPLSHFVIAALAVVGVAAAPLPTQPSSSVTLERRGGFSDFITDMIQEYADAEFMAEVGDVSYKADISHGLEMEKELQEDPTEG